MEITLEQVLDAIGKNPSLLDGLLQPVLESEKGKLAVTNRVNAGLADKISEVHSRYDADMLEILNEKPGQKADGSKEKTYEKIKAIYGELAALRTQKDSLTKDAEVTRLTTEIERLKKEGGGTFVQAQFDQARQGWEAEKTTLTSEINTLKEKASSSVVENAISVAAAQLEFNPDTSETIRNIVLKEAKQSLITAAKIGENGDIGFFGTDGKPLINPATHAPMNAAEALASVAGVKDLLVKEKAPGGGAATVIKGNVRTTTVEGKDIKKLEFPEGSFKSKTEFINVAEKALKDFGFTTRSPEWTKLKDEAYTTYKVNELPAV